MSIHIETIHATHLFNLFTGFYSGSVYVQYTVSVPYFTSNESGCMKLYADLNSEKWKPGKNIFWTIYRDKYAGLFICNDVVV